MTSATVQTPTVLRQIIDGLGIRHNFLAERLGVTRSHFTRMLNRERPMTREAVRTLSERLKVPEETFFDGNELILSSDIPTSELPPLPASSEDGAAEAGDAA